MLILINITPYDIAGGLLDSNTSNVNLNHAPNSPLPRLFQDSNTSNVNLNLRNGIKCRPPKY